jgi:copper chaperone CopZ
MPTQKLHVPRIRKRDEAEISTSLRRLDGVLFAVASHRDECVEVEFEDDCVTIEEVVRELARLGHAATPAG